MAEIKELEPCLAQDLRTINYKEMKADTPVKILLVDDRSENLLALQVILSNENYACVKASSGKEALKMLLREQGFALILMDVQMPVMDGFETADLIRQSERFKHLPIIFLTANMNAPEYIFKGYQAGAVDYLIKPFSPEILRAKVSVFVDLYKKNQELLHKEEQMKMLNAQLQKQSHYVRSLIEAGTDPLITISEEGAITDLNDALTLLTGIPREKLLGTPFFEYFTNPHRAREMYEEVFANGSVAETLLTLRGKGGKRIEMLCNGSVYRDEWGVVIGVVINAREKHLSKYSRSLIEASLDPLVTINAEGKITDVNEATVNVTGHTREEIKGSDFFHYFTEREKAQEVYEAVFNTGFVIDYPLTIRHKQGKLTDVLFNGSVYKDDRGNVLGVVIIARDITARKKFEQDLIEAKSHAEQERQVAEAAVKSKQQFLANMSHEIRTPMNSIIGFTRVLFKTDLNSKQREYLDAIKISGDTLIVLINDILDLAKVDAGKMTFEYLPFKPSDSLATVVQLFETKIRESNLELESEFDPSVPDVLVGDPVRLHQIFLNLVGNAIKFTPSGKIMLGAHLLDQDADSATVEFSVADTGIGIPANKQDTIFDNFQQATSGTTRLYGGTGLGLAIVKQLLEAQGGTIRVKSEVDKGSVFSFVLTFRKTTEKAKTEKEEVTAQDLDTGLKGARILVVEDVALNQLLVKTWFDEMGVIMDEAENGKIAIEKVKKNSYDLILMDLQMPEMNGFEATSYIRSKLKSDIPIIALTADVTTMDVEKCKAIGMNDYLSKPIDEKALYKKIGKFLHEAGMPARQDSSGRVTTPTVQGNCVNLNYLSGLTKNNAETISKIIELYLQETPRLLMEIKQAVERKDWEALRMASHSLLPSFRTMGMDVELEAEFRKMEAYAGSRLSKGEDKGQEQKKLFWMKELISKTEHVCERAYSELRAHLLIIQ